MEHYTRESVFVLLYLDKMIAAAKRSDRKIALLNISDKLLYLLISVCALSSTAEVFGLL